MRRGLVGVVAAAVLVGFVPSANAAFHLIKIREVSPGTDANPNSEWVQLQMYSAGQNFVAGHPVTFYSATGTQTASATFPEVGSPNDADLPNGNDQASILVSTMTARILTGVQEDLEISPGLEAAGGAVCFDNIDCVSWGNFTGTLPSPAGFPQEAIPDGSTIERTIQPGNSAALEETDDTNQSHRDFGACSPPWLRNNLNQDNGTPCLVAPSPRTDTDGDNVPDDFDACPAEAATTANGCPSDSDGDGLVGSADQCPNVFGPASNNGCPLPTAGDGDGDGVPDSSDQCPVQAGPASNNGCPVGGSDNTPPSQTVTGAKTQDVDKLSLSVTPNEAATLVGTGTVRFPVGNKLVKFKKVTKSATAGQKVKLRFKLARGALQELKDALADGARKARLKVTATDAAGNDSVVRKTITLMD